MKVTSKAVLLRQKTRVEQQQQLHTNTMSEKASSSGQSSSSSDSAAGQVPVDPVKIEIDEYKIQIGKHQQRIEKIEAGQGIYGKYSVEQICGAIDNENKAIHDCEAAIDRLRAQQQQGKFLILFA